MAFNRLALSGNIGVGSDAPTVFTYQSPDDETTIITVGYFNDEINQLTSGDLIMTFSEGTKYNGWLVVDVDDPAHPDDVTTTVLVGG